MGSPATDVPKSTPGHGGVRPGAGRPKGSVKKDQNDAYTVLAKARAKREMFRAQMEELRYREAAKEFLPAADFERAMASAFKIVTQMLESLPDVLERDAGIDGHTVERCQEVIDRVRDDLFREMSRSE